AQLHNLYGPTEAAIDVSYWDCSGDISRGVPIGKPIDNIQLVILDAHLNVVPKGAVGELHIGGDGLARGYHNRAELTAQTFINNPFYDASKTNSSKRLYKTGDLARLRQDGEIEYQGRTDHQVKIRGLRIELGEIEHRLGGLATVDSALVLAQDLAGSMQLIAYVKSVQVIAENELADYVADIKAQLAKTMPVHMVPGILMVLEQWPLTPNGKVDRKALAPADGSGLQGEYVAPTTQAEQALVDICADLLNIDAESVSTTANFFELGGHSLMGLKVVTRLRALDMSLTISDILTHNNLIDLAQKISGAVVLTGSKSAIKADCTYITPDMLDLIELNQTELDLLMADSAGGVTGGAENIQDIYPLSPLQQGIFYQNLVQTEIDPYITYQIFSVEGDSAYQKFIEAFEHLVAEHDILRTSFHWQQLSQPVQVVERNAVLPIEILPDAQNAEQLITERLAARTFKFTLEKAPMLNFTVCKKTGTQTYSLGIEFHHLVDDNIAISIFANQVGRFMAGETFTVPYEKQYRNYIQRVIDTPLAEAETFFKSSLADISALSYIFDIKEQNETEYQLKAVEVETLIGLKNVARKYKVGLPTLIHVAWSMVVGMASGQSHVVFGTVLSGRMGNVAGMEDMAGPLINTLPLAVNLDTSNLVELFSDVESTLKNLVKFEYTPLSMAKECCDFHVSGELFNSIVNYRFAEDEANDSDDTPVQGTGGEELVHYPFALNANDSNTELSLVVYAPKHIGAQRMLGYLDTALNAIVNADASTGLSNMLPEAEVRQLVHEFNEVTVNYSKDQCIHQLFEQQAQNNPDSVAVVLADQQLTYGQLNDKANQLAHHLKANHDIKPDTLVGLCVTRSLEMMIGILAILKA
ncbi:MAG: AMP-binding protein, partial [Psychrosphaera sp.]|nr:AMP-binding protein [Psychrosphaera sp.]